MGGPFWWPEGEDPMMWRWEFPGEKRSVHISPPYRSSPLPPRNCWRTEKSTLKRDHFFFFKGKFHLKQPKDVACRPRLESKRLTAAQKSPYYMQPLHLDNDDDGRRFLWPWPTHWASSGCHTCRFRQMLRTEVGQTLRKSHATIASPQACCICLSILDNSSEPRSCEVIWLPIAGLCFLSCLDISILLFKAVCWSVIRVTVAGDIR